MNGARIEAVVDRDIAGERIVDAFLGLEREHLAPAVHVLCAFDGLHADVGAAVDHDGSVAIMLPTQIQQFQQNINLGQIVEICLEELKIDAIGSAGFDLVAIESIDDHRAVLSRSDDEREFSWRIWHG